MTCPSCNGRGNVEMRVHVACGGIDHTRTQPCLRCHGKGVVPDEMTEWIEAGRSMQATRKANNRTIREQAALIGIDEVLLSKMEHGMVDPLKEDKP